MQGWQATTGLRRSCIGWLKRPRSQLAEQVFRDAARVAAITARSHQSRSNAQSAELGLLFQGQPQGQLTIFADVTINEVLQH